MEVNGFGGQGHRLSLSKGKGWERGCEPELWVQAVCSLTLSQGEAASPGIEAEVGQIRYLEHHVLLSSCKLAECVEKHTSGSISAMLVLSLLNI